MQFYRLLNWQHVVGIIFPTLLFVLVFAISLGFMHFHTADSEQRQNTVHTRYPEGLEDREAPFPLAMILIVAGAGLWGFFYILATGLLEVKI